MHWKLVGKREGKHVVEHSARGTIHLTDAELEALKSGASLEEAAEAEAKASAPVPPDAWQTFLGKLGKQIAGKLSAKYSSMEDVAAASDEDLRSIGGIGAAAILKIREALAS